MNPLFALLLAVEAESVRNRTTVPPDQCEAWIAGVAKGDAAAFDALYRATDRTVYAYALSLTRNREDAQDVMMETYLSIRTGAHLYRSQGKPLAWIFTIARNHVRMRARTAGRETPLGDALFAREEPAAADGGEDALVLREALHILSEEERQVVLLHAVSGLRHRETAAALGLPLATVLSKYSRALRKLKNHLERLWEGD